jgi:Tfp pilus assembly protein PilF
LLAPWLAAEAGDLGAALEAIQLLWIRAGHQAGRVEATSAWVRGEYAAGRLRPAAAGAASLLLIDDEDFAGARALADPALDQDPAQPEALVARASIALAEQQTARAEQLLEAALALGRDDGRVWSTLGMSSLQAQDLPKAQVRFERALRKMPRHIGTWHALGWTRLLRRDHAGALAAFRAALALDENFAESHGAVGLLLALTGAAEAQHHLKVAERLDPANVTGRYARALLRGEARELAQLQALARRLLDRPGFFGRGLAEEVERAAPAD